MDGVWLQAMLVTGADMGATYDYALPETAYPTQQGDASDADRMRATAAVLVQAVCLVLAEGAI